MTITLSTLASIAEDIPYCGTRPPRPPWTDGPHVPWGPTPEPWKLPPHVEVGLYAAIALHQLAQRASGGGAERMSAAAQQIFDDTCPTVPISELLRHLLHHPPPPPPPWLQQIIFLAEMARLTHGISQAEAISGAAIKQLDERLKSMGKPG